MRADRRSQKGALGEGWGERQVPDSSGRGGAGGGGPPAPRPVGSSEPSPVDLRRPREGGGGAWWGGRTLGGGPAAMSRHATVPPPVPSDRHSSWPDPSTPARIMRPAAVIGSLSKGALVAYSLHGMGVPPEAPGLMSLTGTVPRPVPLLFHGSL